MAISRGQFELIKSRWGSYSSWAVWRQHAADERVKAGIGDLTVLNPDLNADLLEILNPNVVMVGLNASSRPMAPPAFSNFHDSSGRATDFKIRYAFEGTPFWGAYMTDVFKGLHETDSRKVFKYLNENPSEVIDQIDRFRAELVDLAVNDPLLICFGAQAYTAVQANLGNELRVVKVTHYAHQIGKENYRLQVLQAINEDGRTPLITT